MFHFLNVASGSKGNMSIIYNEDSCLVIDFGVTKKAFLDGLKKCKKEEKDVDAFLFTHDHGDHIKGIDFAPIEKCFSVKNVIYGSPNHDLKPYETYAFGSINVTILETSHDASNSCGFLFEDEDMSVAYITDTGTLNNSTLEIIRGKNYYYFESNYDDEMLRLSGRPQVLINRIKSKKGHLSNKKSAETLLNLVNSNTKKVVLCHLSEECNDPKVAVDTHEEIWHSLDENKNIELICAKQREATKIC